MARPTKKTEDLKAQGTYRKHRHEDRLKVPLLDIIPTPPSTLAEGQEATWYKYCGFMKRDGILSDTYLDIVELYCNARSTWLKARAEVDATGIVFVTDSGQTKQNPAVAIEKEMMALMVRILQEFGYTPRAANSVKVKAGAEEEKDILDFLNDN